MKKFLSKVLTFALVCAIAVTSTSITSEAKGKKSSKKAVATTYSSNAVINDFVATMLKSNGLTINGKSYNSQELITLGFAANPAVTVSPMYWQTDGTLTHEDGSVSDTGSGRCCGFSLSSKGAGWNPYANYSGTESIYNSDITEFELGDMKAYGCTYFGDDATLNSNGVWYTDMFAAYGVNTQYISSWMQLHGFNTATDIYNYLVANGATFTVNPDCSSIDNNLQSFICVQCPNLYYDIDIDNQGTDIYTDIYYENNKLSGVNFAGIRSSSTSTQWYSEIQD